MKFMRIRRIDRCFEDVKILVFKEASTREHFSHICTSWGTDVLKRPFTFGKYVAEHLVE